MQFYREPGDNNTVQSFHSCEVILTKSRKFALAWAMVELARRSTSIARAHAAVDVMAEALDWLSAGDDETAALAGRGGEVLPAAVRGWRTDEKEVAPADTEARAVGGREGGATGMGG
jgi:hypothetical protein